MNCKTSHAQYIYTAAQQRIARPNMNDFYTLTQLLSICKIVNGCVDQNLQELQDNYAIPLTSLTL